MWVQTVTHRGTKAWHRGTKAWQRGGRHGRCGFMIGHMGVVLGGQRPGSTRALAHDVATISNILRYLLWKKIHVERDYLI